MGEGVEEQYQRLLGNDSSFYRWLAEHPSSLHGAQVGDLFMTLIHTCQLCGANSFHYLTELQRHARELEVSPSAWMPWNYRDTLQAL